MNLLGSLYNGVSGVNAMGQGLNVTANNVANVNTNAFKGSQTLFSDVYESALGDLTLGHGVRMGNVPTSYALGSLETTSRGTDMAVNGAGFFLLRDADEALAATYTRSGNFNLVEHFGAEPNAYNLVTPAGQYVQGYNLSAESAQPGVIEDILVQRIAPQSATSHVDLVVNLDSSQNLNETTSVPLFESWDGRMSPPIAAANFDYKSSMQIYGPEADAADPLNPAFTYDLTVYFDGTGNANEKEFLITCDPLLDQRLLGDDTRYAAASDKGAGALLYGILTFSPTGELSDIQCWDVPPDGSLTPAADNRLSLDRGESFFSFDYNFDPAGPNQSSTISFGATPTPQTVESPSGAYLNAEADTPISALSGWENVFDAQGNQVQEGDVILFSGSNGEGEPVSYAYTVNFSQSLQDLLAGLEEAFSCTATLSNGRLSLSDNTVGASALAIDSIAYSNAGGETPATNPAIAQLFGAEGSYFPAGTEAAGFRNNALATTSYAAASTTIFQGQNGYGQGRLQDISVDADGVIIGQYSNGQNIEQAQLVLATFTNHQGLRAEGHNSFVATPEAGAPILGTPSSGPFGRVANYSLEMSNVDLGREMVNLITTQRAFQANAKSISTTDEIYEKLLQMVR